MNKEPLPKYLEKMQEHPISDALLIGKDGDIKNYLSDAFGVCEKYSRKRGIRFNQTEFLHKRIVEIIKMSSTPYQMLNPNDTVVQNMVKNGSSLYDIWTTMKKSYGKKLAYIPFEDRKTLIPKLTFTGFEEGYENYPMLKVIHRPFRPKDVTYKTYLRNIWKNSDHYEKLLTVFMDLMQYHSSETLQMIDLFTNGLVSKTICALYSYIVDVILTYSWCFIREIDTRGLIDSFVQYRNNVLSIIKECILSFMYYNNIDNIPENLNRTVLSNYGYDTTTILLHASSYTNKVSFLDSTTAYLEGPVVFAESKYPILSRDSYGLRDHRYSAFGVDIDKRCSERSYVKYKTMTELYDDVITDSINELKSGWKEERLFMINTKTGNRFWKNVDNILQCPWVRLEYQKEDRRLYTEVPKTEESRYKDAPSLSDKQKIKSSSSDDRNCSAMYSVHTVQGIPKLLLQEKKIIRRNEYDEDFYKPTNVRYNMGLDQIGNITDRTLGFEEFDMYNKNPGGDIDRSSWEPRRNNWTLTH